jgi:hypothetical protein
MMSPEFEADGRQNVTRRIRRREGGEEVRGQLGVELL